MKQKAVIITTMIFILSLSLSAFAADVAKIGVIDFQKILNESSAGKMTRKDITSRGAEFQEKLKAEKDQLDEMKKAFEREALVLSPEKQAEKQREFRIRVNDFKKMQTDFGQQFKQLEMKLLNKIQGEVFKIANEIGKEEGYLLILEKKAGGVVYHPEQIDITEKIIKRYNVTTAKAN